MAETLKKVVEILKDQDYFLYDWMIEFLDKIGLKDREKLDKVIDITLKFMHSTNAWVWILFFLAILFVGAVCFYVGFRVGKKVESFLILRYSRIMGITFSILSFNFYGLLIGIQKYKNSLTKKWVNKKDSIRHN